MMVRELSLHMQCLSFMANETMVHQGISWNDVLYIVVEGSAVIFDQCDHSIASKATAPRLTFRRRGWGGETVRAP